MTKLAFFSLCILAALLLGIAPGKVRAQRVDEVADRTAALQQAVNDSAELFRSGRFAQAEAILFRLNITPAGTGAWYAEAAHRLFNMGLYLRGQGDGALAIELGERALSSLEKAITSCRARGDVKGEAEAHKARGMIYEHLLHRPESALACYQEAVRLDPKSRNTAALKRAESAVGEINRDRR